MKQELTAGAAGLRRRRAADQLERRARNRKQPLAVGSYNIRSNPGSPRRQLDKAGPALPVRRRQIGEVSRNANRKALSEADDSASLICENHPPIARRLIAIIRPAKYLHARRDSNGLRYSAGNGAR